MAKQRRQRTRPTPKSKQASTPASPRERRPSRSELLEQERRARRRRAGAVRAAAIAGAVAAVVALVAWQLTTRRAEQRTIAALTAGACRYDTRSDPGAVNQHSASPSFRVDPPAGGIHLPSVASGGRYTAESAPPDGEVVHALEHGLIAVLYRTDIPADAVTALEAIADRRSKDVLLLPRKTLSVPMAATAWHRRLLCPEPETDAVRRFVDAYRGDGPENVPR